MVSAARRTRPARRLLAGLAIVTLGCSTVACGSDDEETASTAASTEAGDDGEEGEDYEIVSDAEVTAGLNLTLADADVLVASIGAGATTEDFEEVFEGWEGYEGTVKENETETYLAIEDALSLLKNAVEDEDKDKGATALADLQAAATSYLERHP